LGERKRLVTDEDPIQRLVGFPRPTLDPTEVCEVAGVDRDVGDALWRALGFPDVPEGVIAYTDEDARALRLAAEGLDRLAPAQREQGLRLMLQEARMLSAHLAALAETELDAMPALQARGLRTRLIAEAVESGLERSDLGWLINYALRRQLDAVARRHSTTAADADGQRERLVVAFVDLSDFSALSDRAELDYVGALLTRFESLAFDVVAEASGRVVKLIGDEVMFVCRDSVPAARAALAILEGCARGGLPPARAGLAEGQLLRQGGDYFGTPVNRASRITHAAAPETVVVDDVVHEGLDEAPGLSLEGLGEQRLKGLGPTPLWRVTHHD
jgi:adenylate cyclase